MVHDDAKIAEARDTVRRAVHAADNGNQAGEDAVVQMAAASDLYEALDLVFRPWADRVPPDADMPGWPDDAAFVVNDAWKAGFFEKARAALAKARGRPA